MDSVDEWGTNLVNAFDFYISNIPFLRFLGKDKYEFSVFGSSQNSTTPDARADSRFSDMEKRKASRLAASTESVAAFDRILAGSRGGISGSPGGVVTQGPQLPNMPTAGDMAAEIASLASHLAAFEPPKAPDTTMKGSIAGTFSAMNLNASLGVSTVTERIAKAAEETAKNTRNLQGDKVAA
jgi:hypothetical protein